METPETERLPEIFAQINAPVELMHRLIELSKKFGPELLTAVLGYISIYLINKGSSKYGELNGDVNEEQKLRITKEASEQIAIGAVGMATTAFAAGNPLFAYPEIVAVLGSLKPYLESKYPGVAAVSKAARLDLIVKATAIGVGGYVTYEHAQNVMQALPPLSLSALSIAFSGHIRQEVYRVLTISGGTGLIVGSAYAAYEANKTGNAVGTIMSLAFLALNALFTRNEWKEVQKMGGVRKVVAGACQAVWKSICNLFVSKKRGSTAPKDE
jgi:hypothetical protein